jgi:hypothetical protein
MHHKIQQGAAVRVVEAVAEAAVIAPLYSGGFPWNRL